MSDWYQNIEDQISDQLKNARDKDLRFFRIEEFLRMAKRVDEFSHSCRECTTFKYEIEKSVHLIGKAVSVPGKTRRNYDRLLGKLSKHMRKQHKFFPPFYFTYFYSILYASVASIAALAVSLPFSSISKWFFIIPAFSLGLIIGNIKGAAKDSVVRRNKKLL